MRVDSVLIVDDDALVLRALARYLEGAGKHVVTSTAAEHVRESLRSTRLDLAIVDLLLGPEGVRGGLELVHQLRSEYAEVVIIAYSGAATMDLMTQANVAGAHIVMRKDFEILRRVLEQLESGQRPEVPAPRTVASLDEVEWTYLDSVVRAWGGIRAASKKMRMHRSTLQRKLKKVPAGFRSSLARDKC